jgi:hypothetical protein
MPVEKNPRTDSIYEFDIFPYGNDHEKLNVSFKLPIEGQIAGASYTNETQSWVVLNLGYNIDSLPSTWSTSFKTTENSQTILLSATAVSGDISGTISVNGQVKKQATGHSIGLAYP